MTDKLTVNLHLVIVVAIFVIIVSSQVGGHHRVQEQMSNAFNFLKGFSLSISFSCVKFFSE